MTCIVGFVDKGDIYMGGDSAGVAGLNLHIRKDPKVFKKGAFVFGYTSSFRMGQLIRFRFKTPQRPEGMDDFEYMCTVFVDALRICFKTGGYSKVNDNVETGGDFLVGYNGALYRIESDFQICISEDSFDAVGCGEGFALGALKALDRVDFTPRERVRRVLAVAESLSAGVRGPFVIIKLKRR
jgi:hypothetical protein